MKIIATALFMVLLLNKSLSRMQWVAIFILAGGVALVQVESASSNHDSAHYNYLVGLAAIIVSCLCSGFAGKCLEHKPPLVEPLGLRILNTNGVKCKTSYVVKKGQ